MSDKELIEEARRLENDYGDAYEVMSHMSALADALEAAIRERNAALAAIERVRAIHVRHKDTHKPDPSVINGNWFCCGAVQLGAVDPYACISCGSPEWPCPTIQALDGAPELDPYDDFCPTCDAPEPWHTDTCAVPFRGAPEPEWEYRVEYLVPGGETHATGPMTSLDRAHGFMLENIHGGVAMRRRKAGPWLPVEGEKP